MSGAEAPAVRPTTTGPLAGTSAVSPLFESEWSIAQTIVGAGTRTRHFCPAAIPNSVAYVLLTGTLRFGTIGRILIRTASKLAAVRPEPTSR
jgi:hypothetical protein